MKTLYLVSALVFSLSVASVAFAGDGAEGGASVTQTPSIMNTAQKKNIQTAKSDVRGEWPPHHTGRLGVGN